MSYDAEAVYTNSTLGDTLAFDHKVPKGHLLCSCLFSIRKAKDKSYCDVTLSCNLRGQALFLATTAPFERYSPPRIDTHGFLGPTAHKNGPNGSLPVYSSRGPPSTPELSIHSAISSYVVSPSNWEDSYLDHPSHIFWPNPEYSLPQSPPSIADFYECQKLHAGRDYMGHDEVHVPLHSNPYGHALSGVDMLTRFELPLTESGLGLLPDANLRNLYSYELGGSNPWVGLFDAPDHSLHPLARNHQAPQHRAVQLARPLLDHDAILHLPPTSHNDHFHSASDPNWRSTAIPGNTSHSIGESFIGPIAGLKSTPFVTSNGPSEATQDLMISGQKITMKTARSLLGDKDTQSNGLALGRHHGAVNRSLGTVSNSSQRSTKARPYQRALCKKNLNYTPEYLRVALSRLLKIVGKSLFVSQNILEPSIGSDLANKILMEVRDRTGVWLGDKVSEGESLYFLFIDRTSNLSLICGHDTRTSDRALGHIRSMLDHRPFPCLGKAHGCNSKKCSSSGARPFRFFTEALRDDHIRRQGLRDECTTCGAMIRRGGMNRHVRLIHRETASTPLLGEEGSSEEIS